MTDCDNASLDINLLHRVYLLVKDSVAIATVYLPNWATLKSPATGQKTVGQVAWNWATFHPSAHGSSFFFKLAVFCQFREFLGLFIDQEHSFHQFQGLRRPGEQSIINYPLHVEVDNLNVFLPSWVILSTLWLKSIQIWKIGRIITW